MRPSTRRIAAVLSLVALASCGANEPSGSESQASGAAVAPAVNPTADAAASAASSAPADVGQPTNAGSVAETSPVAEAGAAVEGVAPAAEVSPATAVPEILQFTAPLVGGGEIDFASFAGQPVALWFWAPG